MSPIGRIFIVLNLILSAAFVGWAANALSKSKAYQDEFAKVKSDHEAALTLKEGDISKLNTEIGTLNETARQMREQRDQIQAISDGLKTELDEAKRRNESLDGNLAKITATLNDYNATIAQITTEKDRAMQRANEAEKARDEAQGQAQAAELARRDAADAQGNAETKIGDLEAQIVALNQTVEGLKTQSAIAQQLGGGANVVAMPRIDASVLGVRMDPNGPGLVMLNVGKNQEVQPGYTFEIYRGAQYKGRVRVEDVQDTFCSAVIVGSPKAPIAQGDSASTNL